jgi:YHS domain-containing protein
MKGEVMKIWKLVGVMFVCLMLVSLIGCGKAEEEPVTEAEPEPVVEAIAAVDHTPTAEEIGTEITCPACGMVMTVAAEMPAAMYDGKAYFFCGAEEKAQFMADPEKMLNPPEEAPADTAAESSGP